MGGYEHALGSALRVLIGPYVSSEGVLAYERGSLLGVCNFRSSPVKLRSTGKLLMATDPLAGVRRGILSLPPNSAAWVA